MFTQRAADFRIATLPPVRHELRKSPAAGHLRRAVPGRGWCGALQVIFVELDGRAAKGFDHALRGFVH